LRIAEQTSVTKWRVGSPATLEAAGQMARKTRQASAPLPPRHAIEARGLVGMSVSGCLAKCSALLTVVKPRPSFTELRSAADKGSTCCEAVGVPRQHATRSPTPCDTIAAVTRAGGLAGGRAAEQLQTRRPPLGASKRGARAMQRQEAVKSTPRRQAVPSPRGR